jgi:hypothetical protein
MNTLNVTCRYCLYLNPRFRVQGVCGEKNTFKNIGVCGCVDAEMYMQTVNKDHLRNCPAQIDTLVLAVLTIPKRIPA